MASKRRIGPKAKSAITRNLVRPRHKAAFTHLPPTLHSKPLRRKHRLRSSSRNHLRVITQGCSSNRFWAGSNNKRRNWVTFRTICLKTSLPRTIWLTPSSSSSISTTTSIRYTLSTKKWAPQLLSTVRRRLNSKAKANCWRRQRITGKKRESWTAQQRSKAAIKTLLT